MAKKAIRTTLPSGEITASNIIDKHTGESIQLIKIPNVPLGFAVDDEVFFETNTASHGIEYWQRVYPDFGQVFLEKDTMAEMRDLSPVEIVLIRLGRYKGVKLNGYYAKGDTPAPIEYLLSETLDSDDGGSVIEVNTIKLEHTFGSSVDIRYFGVHNNFLTPSQTFLTLAENYCFNNDKTLDFGDVNLTISDTVDLRCNTIESGAIINVIDNPIEAITINKAGTSPLFDKEIHLPNIINGDKPSVGYVGTNKGLVVYSLYQCRIYFKEISNFNEGLYITAKENTGCSYNTFFIGHLLNNKHNLTLSPDTPGSWCNENLFIGGRLSKRSHEVGDGGIEFVQVLNEGKDYTDATVTINSTSGSGGQVDVTLSGGRISNVDIISRGSGYPRTTTASINGDGTGGRIRLVVAEPDSSQIRLFENPFNFGGADNNQFIHNSIEGDNVVRHLYCEGRNNIFDQLRWEATAPNAHFVRISGSLTGGGRNLIRQGYGVDNLLISRSGSGIFWNQVDRESKGTSIESFNQAFKLRSSNGTSVIRVFGSVGAGALYNSDLTTSYEERWNLDIGAFGLKAKGLADNAERVFINAEDGYIALGNGTGSSMPRIIAGSGTPEGNVTAPIGSIYLNRSGSGSLESNVYQKISGTTSSNGWRILTYQPTASTTQRGIVLKAGSVSDNATVAAGANPTKAEFDALYNDFVDLKTKLRAAGQLT